MPAAVGTSETAAMEVSMICTICFAIAKPLNTLEMPKQVPASPTYGDAEAIALILPALMLSSADKLPILSAGGIATLCTRSEVVAIEGAAENGDDVSEHERQHEDI